MQSADLSQIIKAEAIRLGFFNCGIAATKSLEEDTNFHKEWLEKGMNAGMTYLERNQQVRNNPEMLVENAKSIIVVLFNYFSLEKPKDTTAPKISKYAYSVDYHYVIKNKLNELVKFIQELKPEMQARVFTDSAPIFERRWAQLAGLGWIGRNTCLITKSQGSFFFIGEIVTDLELKYDAPFSNDYCGTCNRCINACPTAAINSDKSINSNLCISYQTIENRGELPESLRNKMQNQIFGCDICQDVCPWNKKSVPTTAESFRANSEIFNLTLENWKDLQPSTYKEIFKNSPIERIGYQGLKRNIKFILD